MLNDKGQENAIDKLLDNWKWLSSEHPLLLNHYQESFSGSGVHHLLLHAVYLD